MLQKTYNQIHSLKNTSKYVTIPYRKNNKTEYIKRTIKMNRKKIITGIAAFIFACTIISGCKSAQDEPSVPVMGTNIEDVTDAKTDMTTEAAKVTQPEETTVTETVTDSTTAEEAPETQPEIHTQPALPPVTEADNNGNGGGLPDYVSTTSKGYKIERMDGITYVDGIMMASKTYTLPASYDPGIRPEAYDAYLQMKSAAANDGITLWIVSGYRSYYDQEIVYAGWVNRDGKEKADTYSSRPGHSDHQTGYTFDLNSLEQSFADTAEGKWLAAHCAEYGFIIRYPNGKEMYTGYIYEPWHVRYIGVEKAKKITESGLSLEEYYGITSNYANSEDN
ncbi:MAG: M15 family metallopeptidase [Ruminiclostridium sp.]|nr:M15 family metallopeptidase [Ruminiclostridium sp.]